MTPRQPKKFKIILLSGQAHSGKDTAAYRLTESHGFKRIAFADYIKDICTDLLDKMGCQIQRDWFDDPVKKEQFILDMDGDIFLFATPGKSDYGLTYRQLLQNTGEAIKNNIHMSVWTYPVKKFITEVATAGIYNGVVVSDFRFRMEYDEIERFCTRFGSLAEIITVRIARPALNSTDTHISEHDLKNFEFTLMLNNNGTIPDLFTKVDKVATGAWQLDKLNADIARRTKENFLNKYRPDEGKDGKDNAV